MGLLERFLQYVAIDTQSDENSESFPSTQKQYDLLNLLAEQMKQLGMTEVEVDKNGYAMGSIPATPGYEDKPVIGFIAHVDTAPDMSGKDVKPRVIEKYDGGDIELNPSLTMYVKEFPELLNHVGHKLVVTDGTTLLGADDKAGVAEIMHAAEWLMTHPEVAHGKIRLGFTPDEEIGRGVDFFDVEHFGARFAYTLDGGPIGELEYENFNAAGAKFVIQGRNIHPGYAKDKMINSLQILCEINSMLPAAMRPEHTQGYEGFYHLVGMSGGVETAEMSYIVRDHCRTKFEQKKTYLQDVADFLNKKYGEGVVTLNLRDQYYNMREQVELYPEVVDKAIEAMKLADVEPIIKPIRGGTDGARLSFMNLPCPNLFTGMMNFHGKYEYCSVDTMEKAVETILNLVKLWAK
ncbi:MAG: peptidase T [Rikenellaceae bacterium]|nr:peptidase T [Rikenellaceae bacterium]